MTAFRTIEVSDPRFECDGLRQVTVKSAALGSRADITVYSPQCATVGDALPLVILLHGVYGSHWAWALKGGAHCTARQLIADGEIPPMVLAMPSDGLAGDGSGYVAHARADFERWIVGEVPLAVAHAAPGIRPSSPRFIAGLSMGGYGALRILGRHGAQFRAASAHSAIIRFAELSGFVEEDIDEFAPPAAARDVGAVLRRAGRLPPFRFDCGIDDRLLESNRALHAELKAADIAHVYEELPGGHEWSYWERNLERTLRFFARVLESTSQDQRS